MNFEKATEKFAQHRILLLRGEVNGNKQDILCTAIELLDLENNDPITLRIDSPGGSATPARILVDCIMFAKSPIHGVVTGLAHSAAFRVLQACDKRLAYPNAKLLFHGTANTELRIDDPRYETELQKLRKIHEVMLKQIAKKSGHPIAAVRKWSREEHCYDAEEALKLGLIDEILTPQKK